eukprot:SAG11_NODE_22200_length_410_cov_0.935691_1_plen_77_part_10
MLLLLLQSDETMSVPGSDARSETVTVGEILLSTALAGPTKADDDDGHGRSRREADGWQYAKDGVVVVENCSVVIAGG